MILCRFLKFPVVGRMLWRLIMKMENGEKESQTLRRIFKNEYGVEVGLHSYGGCFDEKFNMGGEVKFGRYCSIAGQVRYFGANHPINQISNSPYFYNKKFGYKVDDVKRSSLVVGNDVWLGYGVIILPSCTKIGNGAVVGAGSVVTHDVEPYTIVAGNPAKTIRYRFSKEECSLLENSQWWELEPTVLIKYYKTMKNISLFVKQLEESEEPLEESKKFI